MSLTCKLFEALVDAIEWIILSKSYLFGLRSPLRKKGGKGVEVRYMHGFFVFRNNFPVKIVICFNTNLYFSQKFILINKSQWSV